MAGAGKTLVMAGAREAHSVINGLVSRGRDVVASLPEPERVFGPLPVKTRVGAFGSVAEMRTWMQAEEITTLIDAGHAFDDQVTRTAFLASSSMDVRYLRVLRPPWVATGQDSWASYPNVRKAVEAIGPGLVVFSNTGWASLPDYADFKGRIVYLRQTHEVQQASPYQFLKFLSGKPPFSQQQEEVLFRDLGVARLLCRNVGGAASMSKLLAARKLGIRVLMVDRPPLPVGAISADTVAEALAWEANG